MVRLCGFFLLILSAFVSVGQNQHQIDSLSKLASTKKGDELFSVLNRLAWEYRFLNADSTIRIADRAYQLGKKLNLKQRLARPLNYTGVAYEYKGEVLDAYDFYKQALNVATQQLDATELAYANNNIGRLFHDQGNTAKATGYYETALKGFQQTKDSLGIGYVYLNYAQLYLSEKKYREAEKYFKMVHDIRLRIERRINISSLLQLGQFYLTSGDLKKSTVQFLQADSIAKVRHDFITLSEVDLLLGENYLQLHELTKANDFAQQGFRTATSKNLPRLFSRYYLLFGKIAFENKQLTQASNYLNLVLQSARPFKDLQPKMDAHYYLGQIYNQLGQREKGLENQNEYLAIRDSLKERELRAQVMRLKFQFELEIEQKEKENKLLKELEAQDEAIIRKQRALNYSYASALVVVVVIAVLLYRNIRLKQKHNDELNHKQELIVKHSEELEAKNLEIEKTNSNLEALVQLRTQMIMEKNRLLMEYAYFNSHRVRGPLARILGLLVVMDLEQHVNNSDYIEMLRHAGKELDEAIRHINAQIAQSGDELNQSA